MSDLAAPDDEALRMAELDLMPAFGRLQDELRRALSIHVGQPATEEVRRGVERAVSDVLKVPVTVVVEESTQTFRILLSDDPALLDAAP